MICATIAKLTEMKSTQELMEMITVKDARYSSPRYKLEITISSKDKMPVYIKMTLLKNWLQ